MFPSWRRNRDTSPPIIEPTTPESPRALHVSFSAPIDAVGASRLVSACNVAVNEGFAAIEVAFNSPGGYVGDGIFLYNYLRALPIPVHFHNIGTVASIAVVVFLAGERRTCSLNALFLIHPVSTTPGGPMATEPWRSMLDYAMADEDRIDAVLALRTRLDAPTLRRRRLSDVMFTPDQAREVGLVETVADFTLPAGQQLFNV